MKSPICSMLGIEFPLLAFSHCRDVVAAVSRAGGFGVLGATAHSPETIEQELKWIDDHTDGKPYGLDVLIPENISTAGEKDVTWKSLEARISPQHHRRHIWRARFGRLWKAYLRVASALAGVIGTLLMTVQYFVLMPPFAWLAKRGARRERQGWTAADPDAGDSLTRQY